MRADIHGGPEHDTLQYEAGYIDARPTSNRSTKTSCDARPDHTMGQSRHSSHAPVTSGLPLKADILGAGRQVSKVPLTEVRHPHE